MKQLKSSISNSNSETGSEDIRFQRTDQGQVLQRPDSCVLPLQDVGGCDCQGLQAKLDSANWAGSMRIWVNLFSCHGHYQVEISAPLDPVASTEYAFASTEEAVASANSNRIVPSVEAGEAVEANPHTLVGFSS